MILTNEMKMKNKNKLESMQTPWKDIEKDVNTKQMAEIVGFVLRIWGDNYGTEVLDTFRVGKHLYALVSTTTMSKNESRSAFLFYEDTFISHVGIDKYNLIKQDLEQ